MLVEQSRASGWVAWVLFGGILMVLLGSVHLSVGLIALWRPEVLGGGRADLLLGFSLTALAWVHIVLGVLAAATGVGLVRGVTWARVLAVLLSILAAVVNFLFLSAHPVWSVIAIGLAAVVIFSVIVHGGEVADAYGS